MVRMVVDMLLKQLPPETGPMVDRFLKENINTIDETKKRLALIEAQQRAIIAHFNIEVSDDSDSSGEQRSLAAPTGNGDGS